MSDSSTVGPGTVLAERYELTGIIGRGGFGTVWKARQLNMDRDVAIKVLPPQFLSLKDVVERFKREAKLASRLRHPNTITLHDYGHHDNLLYIVMELLTGEDLADVLKSEGRLPPERIMHIARQVLKSLAEAHEQSIVHRDLKPENIFLSVVGDDRDHVKVVDFGIAKLLQPTAADAEEPGGRRLTMSGSTVGTPTYMSPEQAAGEDVDGQTDLYALGIIMYEAANGRPPFHNKDPVKVMRAQLFDAVPPLRDPKLRGTLLDRVIQKALQKDKEDRFLTASDMLLALAGEPVAKPVIRGISMDKLDEPSTSDLTEDTGPNTEDFAHDRFPNTLSFAKGIAQGRDGDEAVPFDVVDAHAETMVPRSRHTVRQADAADRSGEIDVAGASEPPGAIQRPPADRSDENISSSIITVIEEEEEDGNDSGVILLTKKKTPASNEAQSASHTPTQPATAAAPAKSASADVSSERPLPPKVAPPPSTKKKKKNTGRDSDIFRSWEWEPGVELEPDEEAAKNIPRKDGIGFWILLIVIIAAVTAAVMYL